MNKLALILIGIFVSSSLRAQNLTPAYFVDRLNMESATSRIDTNDFGEVILVSEFKTNNVKVNSNMEFERYYLGTPFFENGWYKGKVILEGGEPVEGVMAYDLVRNVVYYSKNATTNAIELRPMDFTIGTTQFSKFEGEYSGAGNYYYETLVASSPMLLKQYVAKYSQSKSEVDNGYGSTSTDKYEGEYVKEIKYYVALDGRLNLVKNKKAFFRSLGPYSEEATAYVRREKLKIGDEEDTIKLITYLGTLSL